MSGGKEVTLGRRRRRGEEGVGLVETLIAVGILGLALTVLLAAVSTGSLAVSRTEERVAAENLARSQLEYTKSQGLSRASCLLRDGDPFPRRIRRRGGGRVDTGYEQQHREDHGNRQPRRP